MAPKSNNPWAKKNMRFGGLDNPCKVLSIVGSAGAFTTTGKLRLVGLSVGGKEEMPLRFHVQHARYEVGNLRPAWYFVMPLLNCVAELTDRLLGQHPLRIFPDAGGPGVPFGDRQTMGHIRSQRKESCGSLLHRRSIVLRGASRGLRPAICCFERRCRSSCHCGPCWRCRESSERHA